MKKIMFVLCLMIVLPSFAKSFKFNCTQVEKYALNKEQRNDLRKMGLENKIEGISIGSEKPVILNTILSVSGEYNVDSEKFDSFYIVSPYLFGHDNAVSVSNMGMVERSEEAKEQFKFVKFDNKNNQSNWIPRYIKFSLPKGIINGDSDSLNRVELSGKEYLTFPAYFSLYESKEKVDNVGEIDFDLKTVEEMLNENDEGSEGLSFKEFDKTKGIEFEFFSGKKSPENNRQTSRCVLI